MGSFVQGAPRRDFNQGFSRNDYGGYGGGGFGGSGFGGPPKDDGFGGSSGFGEFKDDLKTDDDFNDSYAQTETKDDEFETK